MIQTTYYTKYIWPIIHHQSLSPFEYCFSFTPLQQYPQDIARHTTLCRTIHSCTFSFNTTSQFLLSPQLPHIQHAGHFSHLTHTFGLIIKTKKQKLLTVELRDIHLSLLISTFDTCHKNKSIDLVVTIVTVVTSNPQLKGLGTNVPGIIYSAPC